MPPDDPPVVVLERGDIRFFYRPRVQPEDAIDHVPVPGVQSFFLILAPAGSGAFRRVRVGKKRMPMPTGERFWARVERVGSLDRVLGGLLEDEHYQTKRKGERYQPGARAIASGCYAIVRHDDHCHLAYRADQFEADDVPDDVRIPEAGSLVILHERIPPARAIWTTAGEPARLDAEGAELVLVGVDDAPERALGIDILPPR